MPKNDRPVLRITPAAHRIWALGAWATAGLGLLFTLVLWPSPRLLAFEALLCGAVFVSPTLRAAWVRTLRWCCFVVIALLGSVGLIGVLGGAGVLLAMAVGGSGILLERSLPRGHPSSPATPGHHLSAARSRLQHAGARSHAEGRRALPGADDIADIDDSALCHAWRHSFVRLESSSSLSQRLRLVELRQLYLDELDRRHPVQLRSWFASGARAAGNPLPYLRRPTDPPRC